jgi:AcrR family transcriptional regulator
MVSKSTPVPPVSPSGPSSLQGTRGRPSQVEERSEQLIAAFIQLVAAHGLEATSLTRVSEVSGISRTAIRHFVGNREELIAAAVTQLASTYAQRIRIAVGNDPQHEDLIRLLFSEEWTNSQSSESQAFDALLHEAIGSAELAAKVRAAYQQLIDLLATSLQAAYAKGSVGSEHRKVKRKHNHQPERYEAAAYAIVCLSEHHSTMRAPLMTANSAETAS